MDHLAQLDKPSRIRAEFFLDEDDNREYCKISIIGDPSNLIKRVTPDVIAKYSREWETYKKQSGRSQEDVVGGTPLREIPGVDRDAAAVLRYNSVRNVEEFAALDEQTARQLGAGFLNFWRSAKLLLQAREAEQLRRLLDENASPKRGPGRPRKAEQSEKEAQSTEGEPADAVHG